MKSHYNHTHWAPEAVAGDADSTYTAQWTPELLFLELGVVAASGSLFSPRILFSPCCFISPSSDSRSVEGLSNGQSPGKRIAPE